MLLSQSVSAMSPAHSHNANRWKWSTLRPGRSTKHQDVVNELRNSLAELVTKIEAASAMQLHDINRLAETVVLSPIRAILGMENIRKDRPW